MQGQLYAVFSRLIDTFVDLQANFEFTPVYKYRLVLLTGLLYIECCDAIDGMRVLIHMLGDFCF